ncbi:uncharacterized protein LOC118481756 [Helianthus annuus]|uniref:uncharacterized protein LOC118481756 n=1 Tax=Helianthus annuus TaxID=4232 RepID=UPI001652E739|nr:uncharacterized protein LOC118481756 [Helianthus annuus]
MYQKERLPLVKAAYEKYRESVKRKKQTDIEEEANEEEDDEEEQLIRKKKGKRHAEEGGSSKKKKDTPNPEHLMGNIIRAGSTREHREHIENLRAILEAEEREKRELDEFVDQLIVDPEAPSKSPPQKRKKTGEGSSRSVPAKSRPQQAPRRPHPFQELYDKLSKDIGIGTTQEIFLLKHQVSDTNVIREKLREQRKRNRELHAYVSEQTSFVRFQQDGMEKMYRMIRELCAKVEVQPMFSVSDIFDYEKFKVEEDKRKAEEAEKKEEMIRIGCKWRKKFYMKLKTVMK